MTYSILSKHYETASTQPCSIVDSPWHVQ